MIDLMDLPLEGLRGRLFLLELACRVSPEVSDARYLSMVDGLVDAMNNASGQASDVDAWIALESMMAHSAPYGPPERDSVLCRDGKLVEALRDFGLRTVSEPLWSSWNSPISPLQYSVEFPDSHGESESSMFNPTKKLLDDWHSEVVGAEARERKHQERSPLDRFLRRTRTPLAGAWWTQPVDLPTTSDVNEAGALSLLYSTEDSRGPLAARVAEVNNVPQSILEIDTPDKWVQIVRDAPLDVSASRDATWGSAFGIAREWLVPDWRQVALSWDAVHLTIGCVLAGGAQELPVDDKHSTAIAGWGPGSTLWLTEAPMIDRANMSLWTRESDEAAWVKESENPLAALES